MRVRSVILVTGLLLGAAVCIFVLLRPSCRCDIMKAYREISGKNSPRHKRRLTSIAASNGVSPNGVRFSDNSFVSSDCVLVEEHVQAASLADSSALVKGRLASASRILEQKTTLDGDGNQ